MIITQWEAGPNSEVDNDAGNSIKTPLPLAKPSQDQSAFWGIGYLAGRNQSRSLHTVITFPNQHSNFPFASSSSSTFPLPCSLSPPPPLLSVPSTFPDMWSSEDTPVTVFTALYTFLSSLFLTPRCSLSYPLRAHFSFCLITHQGLFYSGTH